MKLICYCQCGLGDWYDLIAMLPEIIKDKNPDEVELWIDSIYFHEDKFKLEKETAIQMMESITTNWNIVPEEVGSYRNLYYEDERDRLTGPVYEKIKDDFLFYRLDKTKEFMKEQIQPGDIFISAVLNRKFTYEWFNNRNIPLTYKKQPIEFKKPEPYILVHVRKKGAGMTDEFYVHLLAHCINGGARCVLIGDPNEISFTPNKMISDLRGKIGVSEIMHLIETTDFMIGSSSMFTYHRIHFDYPTVICTPEQSGAGKAEHLFDKKDLENDNYLFVDADTNCLKEIKSEVDLWLS